MKTRPERVPNVELSERRAAKLLAEQNAFLEDFDRQVADLTARAVQPPFPLPCVIVRKEEHPMILKRISEDQVAELVDSIIVSVGAEDPSTVTAGVIWMEDGDVGDDLGPMTVPEALALASTIADRQHKDIIYVTLQPDTFEWLEEWGKLS